MSYTQKEEIPRIQEEVIEQPVPLILQLLSWHGERPPLFALAQLHRQ